MKKTKFLTMLALCVIIVSTLTSCEKNEDLNEDLIVGNWEITQAIIDGYDITADENGYIWTFYSNKNSTCNFLIDESTSCTYTINDNILKINSGNIYDDYDYSFWWKYQLDLEIINMTQSEMSTMGTLKYNDSDYDNENYNVSIKFRKM